WERDFWSAGRGDIALHVYGPEDVLALQIGRGGNLQRAYVVILRTEVPLAEAHFMYPEYADRITAVREQPGWIKRGMKSVQKYMAPALNVSRRPGAGGSDNIPYPTTDIYNAYILDPSINVTGKPIPMGEPGTSWQYDVPPLGADIPSGILNSAGQTLYRKATQDDARMYPLRRLMTATSNCVLYDDTSPWWHGKVPLVKFVMDDWPWEFLGFSLTRDNSTIQDSMIRIMRAMDDSANARLRPPLQYDKDLVSKALMERLDPRQPGQTVGMNLSMGEAIKTILSPDHYNIPPQTFALIEKFEQIMDHQMGVNDIASIAKARQLPAADSLEKLLEVAGPLITDMSRNMERSMRDLGEMCKSLFLQFYTTQRKLQILGPDGLVEEDYDYDPGNMIPAHLPGEDLERASRFSMIQRARWHQNNFVFHVTPNSLHQITQLSRKLLYVQLWRGQFPIDPWTLAEVLDVPNFGPAPKGATTVMERWVAWTRMMSEFGLETPGKPVGRPPSGQKAPEIKQKEGGTRSTITES
ncbi:MAG: hypothetical protein ABIH23_30020, partial [bacterium]